MKSHHFTQSVFDRLIIQQVKPTQSIISENIRRNLCALLNTRRYPSLALEPSSNPDSTLANYGLTEILAVNLDDDQSKDNFLAIIAQQISIFEPRLRQVNVSIKEKNQSSLRQLELIIEAELRFTNEYNTLAYRSVIEFSSRFIQLEEPYAERVSGTLSR